MIHHVRLPLVRPISFGVDNNAEKQKKKEKKIVNVLSTMECVDGKVSDRAGENQHLALQHNEYLQKGLTGGLWYLMKVLWPCCSPALLLQTVLCVLLCFELRVDLFLPLVSMRDENFDNCLDCM